MIYPASGQHNGRDVSYGYGTSRSRWMTTSCLAWLRSAIKRRTLDAAYTYLGAGTIASEDYQQPQIKLDYSADNFAALDRFGNVLDQVWASYGSNSGNAGTLDGYSYTYDRAGNRTSRANLTDAGAERDLRLRQPRSLDLDVADLSGGTIRSDRHADLDAGQPGQLPELHRQRHGTSQDRTRRRGQRDSDDQRQHGHARLTTWPAT